MSISDIKKHLAGKETISGQDAVKLIGELEDANDQLSKTIRDQAKQIQQLLNGNKSANSGS